MKIIGDESPYLIHCYECETSTYLTEEQYSSQMRKPDYTWQCPQCKTRDCRWDDDNYEKYIQTSDEELR